MINERENPVEWALALFELSDAEEHLAELTKQMKDNGRIDEEDLRISLGHVYSHLNRAWNSRNRSKEASDSDLEKESEFPDDLNPT